MGVRGGCGDPAASGLIKQKELKVLIWWQVQYYYSAASTTTSATNTTHLHTTEVQIDLSQLIYPSIE